MIKFKKGLRGLAIWQLQHAYNLFFLFFLPYGVGVYQIYCSPGFNHCVTQHMRDGCECPYGNDQVMDMSSLIQHCILDNTNWLILIDWSSLFRHLLTKHNKCQTQYNEYVHCKMHRSNPLKLSNISTTKILLKLPSKDSLKRVHSISLRQIVRRTD